MAERPHHPSGSVLTRTGPLARVGVTASAHYDLTDDVLVRLNELPATSSVPRAARQRLGERVAELIGWWAWRDEHRDALSDELYHHVSAADDELARRVLLPLRRSVHADRPAKVRLEDLDPTVRTATLTRWFEVQARILQLDDLVVDDHAAALQECREDIAAAATTPAFGRAMAVSSTDLHHVVRQYTGVPVAQHRNKERRSEAPLLRYLTRARARTSPFSSFTVVGMTRLSHDATTGGLVVHADRASRIETSHVALRRLLHDVLHHHELTDLVALGTHPGLRRGEHDWTIDLHPDQPDVQPAVWASGNRRASIETTPVTAAVIPWLIDRSAPATRPELVTELAAATGSDVEACRSLVDQLVAAEVLVPAVDLPEQSDDALGDVRRRLGRLDAPVARSVLAELDRVADLQRDLPALDGDARVSVLRALHQRWDDAHAAVGTPRSRANVVFEDVAMTRVGDLHAPTWSAPLAALEPLVAAFHALDRHHVLRARLIDVFVEQYGEGGTCPDVRAFAAHLPDVFARTYDPQAAPLARPHRWLDELAAVQGEVFDAVSHVGVPTIELDPDAVAGWAQRASAANAAERASYGVFVQPELLPDGSLGQVVVNSVYGGWSQYVTRYLPLFDPRVADDLRATFRQASEVGGELVESRPVRGFNANLHPLLTGREVDWSGDADPAHALDPSDLHLVHDVEADAIRVVETSTGRHVHLLYLGFLVPFLLPEEAALVYALSPSGLIGNSLHDRAAEGARAAGRPVPGPTEGTPVMLPRVVLGSVVAARRRWLLRRDDLPRPEVGESDVAYHLRLARWRERHDMPRQVFVNRRPPLDDDDGWRNRMLGQRPKPQLVDFADPLLVRHLPRWFPADDTFDEIVVEEALPVPESAFGAATAGTAHVTELVLQFDREPGAAR